MKKGVSVPSLKQVVCGSAAVAALYGSGVVMVASAFPSPNIHTLALDSVSAENAPPMAVRVDGETETADSFASN